MNYCMNGRLKEQLEYHFTHHTAADHQSSTYFEVFIAMKTKKLCDITKSQYQN